MTIDEAIKHCLEVAGKQQVRADFGEMIGVFDGLDVESCKECAADHRQLAAWLTELKEAKRLLKLAITCLNDGGCTKDCDICTNLEDCIRERHDNSFEWRYTDEVKELIND